MLECICVCVQGQGWGWPGNHVRLSSAIPLKPVTAHPCSASGWFPPVLLRSQRQCLGKGSEVGGEQEAQSLFRVCGELKIAAFL